MCCYVFAGWIRTCTHCLWPSHAGLIGSDVAALTDVGTLKVQHLYRRLITIAPRIQFGYRQKMILDAS